LDRREFFARAMAIGLAVGAASVLPACQGGSEGKKKPAAKPAADKCTTDGLTEADLNLRKSLQYVEVSAKEGQNCKNCKLYVEKECGGCTVIKGPIAEKGWCVSWAAKG